MPFNTQNRNSSFAGQAKVEPSQYNTTNALFQASQTLGSVGAPTSHSRDAGLTSPGSDALLFSSGDIAGVNGSNAANSEYATSPSAPSVSGDRQATQFEPLYQAHTLARQQEEQLMSNTGTAFEAHHYPPNPRYNPAENLSIELQPPAAQYHNVSAGTNVPGALLPGSLNRPAALSSNTAPGSVPTLPQLSTQMQQHSQTTRPAILNQTHSYSRSSPAGMDQPKYKAFTNTPESNKFNSPNTSYISHMSQTGSYSPLGLADIRPRADAGFSDEPMSPAVPSDADAPQYQIGRAHV